MPHKITFKRFVKNLNVFLEKYPETANHQVIFAADNEGNAFYPIVYAPSRGHYEHLDFDTDAETSNAVCIN